MKKVKLTVIKSDCRSGCHKAGDEFIVGVLCPPVCCELWNIIYPYVFALQNGAALDHGDGTAYVFEAACPDGGRVAVRGEVLEEQDNNVRRQPDS
ncbi:MAG: TIGR04076 family protein [Clostridia bacterium]|nr:TIGR04076 family protein [Clostridia bacterium]